MTLRIEEIEVFWDSALIICQTKGMSTIWSLVPTFMGEFWQKIMRLLLDNNGERLPSVREKVLQVVDSCKLDECASGLTLPLHGHLEHGIWN